MPAGSQAIAVVDFLTELVPSGSVLRQVQEVHPCPSRFLGEAPRNSTLESWHGALRLRLKQGQDPGRCSVQRLPQCSCCHQGQDDGPEHDAVYGKAPEIIAGDVPQQP